MVPFLAVSSILIGLLSPDIWFWAFTSLLVISFMYFEIELFKGVILEKDGGPVYRGIQGGN